MGDGEATDLLRPPCGFPWFAPGGALRRSHSNIAGPAGRPRPRALAVKSASLGHAEFSPASTLLPEKGRRKAVRPPAGGSGAGEGPRRRPERRGGGGGRGPPGTKPALRSPPQSDFVLPGPGRPPPPANQACKRPGEAKKHFHSPWEEKNCYSPFTKIFLVFLPLAAASS